jgi:hypothetical protein
MGANVFTPGLMVTRHVHLARERRLPLKGNVVVKKGDRVKAEDVVARTELPGNVHMLNVSGILNVHQSDVVDLLQKKPGDAVEKDETIALSKGLFGLFKSVCKSPISGTLESVSDVTGQAVLREPPMPVEVDAYVDGVVTEVFEDEGVLVECDGTFIQGIFGIGPETFGVVKMLATSPDEEISADRITADLRGQVVVVGSIATTALLESAAKAGVAAVVAGGIDAKDLKDFLGYDLGVAITGSEEKGVTLVTTEGFGRLPIAEKTFRLLGENEGLRAAVNGATQIRAGVMRPEIIIPRTESEEMSAVAPKSSGISVGSTIRVIRAPYFGQLGEVTDLPSKLEAMESETMVRVLRAKLASGDVVTVPRANVEMIEEV